MKPMDTHLITEVAADLVAALPEDKRKHFTASWGLCITGTPLDLDVGLDSFSLLKEGIDAFRVGLVKEYCDRGLDPSDAYALDEAVQAVAKVYEAYKKAGLNAPEHETDLLADMAGIGLFILTQALQGLNKHMATFE